MKTFIKGVLSEPDGTPSSKRVVMFMLTVLFIAISIINIWSGKKLDEMLGNQLFYLLCYVFAIVFGEKVVNIFKKEEPKPPVNDNK